MAKMKGLCRNEECELCDQIQEAEKSNFVCEKCGKPLIPFGGGNTGGGWMKQHGKQLAIGIIALAVIGGGIWGGMALSSGGDEATAPEVPEQTLPVDTVKADSVAVESTAAVEEKQTEAEPQPAPQAEEKRHAQQAERPAAEQPKNGKGTVDLGYGTYTGDLKNGQPHGYGTITYRQRHRIVSSKDFYANPGDRFEGDFRDGRISGIGYWHHDGEQTAIKP